MEVVYDDEARVIRIQSRPTHLVIIKFNGIRNRQIILHTHSHVNSVNVIMIKLRNAVLLECHSTQNYEVILKCLEFRKDGLTY